MTSVQTSEVSLTKMLLTVVLVFYILNMGNCAIVIIGIAAEGFKNVYQEVVSNVPILINSSVNFIIYCAFGKKFRSAFVKTVKSWNICNKVIIQEEPKSRSCGSNVETLEISI